MGALIKLIQYIITSTGVIEYVFSAVLRTVAPGSATLQRTLEDPF